MVTGWRAFRAGLARTLRYPQVWLILLAVNLFSALLLAALPALGLAAGLGHRPAVADAADGLDAWYVLESLLSPLSNAALSQGGATLQAGGSPVGLLVLPLFFILSLLAWLSSAFVGGGLLLTYAEAPQPFGWRRFLWGCWHWWGPFLLLGAIQGLLAGLILVPLLALAAGIVAAEGGWLAWLAIPGLALVTALGLAPLEASRAFAVLDGTQNVLRALSRALRFLFRHPLPAAGLYGLAFLAAGLLQALYHLALGPHLPLERWFLVLVVQQAFVVLRLGVRLVRLGGLVALAADLAPAKARALPLPGAGAPS